MCPRDDLKQTLTQSHRQIDYVSSTDVLLVPVGGNVFHESVKWKLIGEMDFTNIGVLELFN